jgi:hypothetical protein
MNFPWETNEKKINHKENGFDVECTHSGQKRRYGDAFREFTVKSDKPESEVKAYCTEHVRACQLTTEEYLKDERAGVKDFGDHFRSSYKFYKLGDGHYAYVITEPSTH